MNWKPLNVVLPLMLLCLSASAKHDSTLARHRFFLHAIPSNLLSGDVSLGIEHLYKRRLAQEFQASVKCFAGLRLNYNKGYKLNYQLKYNVIHRRYFRLSLNLSTSWQEYSFRQKKDGWYELDQSLDYSFARYLMDRHLQRFGIGGGIGLNARLSKHVFLGSEFLLELSQLRRSYTVWAEDEGASKGWRYFQEPYVYQESRFTGFTFYTPVVSIKLSYLF